MASIAKLSPGAALLRSSRLFSLPQELNTPEGMVTELSMHYSDTATYPYPVLQSIASPRVSRAKGDWGLKRTMPNRRHVRYNPVLRVREHDTFEAVTDYASAVDHQVSLRKWQALNAPITSQSGVERRLNVSGRSVFEDAIDVTTVDPAKRHTHEDKRWKFEGPWLAGISPGEFNHYLDKKVRTRRAEFREFLRAQLAADRNTAAAADAIEHGTDAQSTKFAAADITEEELVEYIRVLRHDRPTLFRLVGKFLDLVPVEPSTKVFQNLARSSGFLSPLTGLAGGASSSSSAALPSLTSLTSSMAPAPSGSPWAKDGPPVTHPSAGISYLRTAAFLENHPLYGPQKTHPPVQARVLNPRMVGSRSAKVGIAGFVIDSPFGEAAYTSVRYNASYNSSRTIPELTNIDPAVYGGPKVNVQVAAARIDSHGRLIVSATEADSEAVLVQDELKGKEKIHGKPSRLMSTRAEKQTARPLLGRLGPGVRNSLGGLSSGQPVVSSPENYGLN